MTTKVAFKLTPEHVGGASHGILVGDFNNWNTEEGIYLEKYEDGSLGIELTLAEGKTYEYRYLLSDGRWVNDNNAKTNVEAFGQIVENCVIDVPVSKKEKKLKQSPKPKTEKVKISDNLLTILGVTDEMVIVLNEDGIKTFSDLGKCTIKRLLLLIENAGLREKSFYYTTWAKQAKLAAAGKSDELKQLKAEIKKKL